MSVEVREYETIIVPNESEHAGRKFRSLRINPAGQYELILGYETTPGKTDADVIEITFNLPDFLPRAETMLRKAGKLTISAEGTMFVKKGYWNSVDGSLEWLSQTVVSDIDSRKIECCLTLEGDQLGPVTVHLNEKQSLII